MTLPPAFKELTPRGKSHYHEDLIVTQGGVAYDFTANGGWTNFVCELKYKNDEDGAAVMVATVAFASGGADGLLDLDITAVSTAAAQAAAALLANEKDGLAGVFDLVGTLSGEVEPIMEGNWALTKGTSD